MIPGVKQHMANRQASVFGVLSAMVMLAWLLASCGGSQSKASPLIVMTFQCPVGECEVLESMMILVLHQTDTPGDNGVVDSSTRRRTYQDAVRSRKIFRVTNGTRATSVYTTPVSTNTTARYSVVKILDGPHAGRSAITQMAH